MSASEPALVVIACPNCGTRYQVAFATIGAKGRNVQCAHCGKSWEARAEAPVAGPDFDTATEDDLDRRFVEEEQKRAAATRRAKPDRPLRAAAGSAPEGEPEAISGRSEAHQRTLDEIKAAIAPRPGAAGEARARPDPTAHRRQQAFSQRQRKFASRLPLARLRRGARLSALGVLGALVVGGILLREPLVEQFPQLAGLYSAVGLGVNVVGLEFRNVRTLKSLQQGAEVLVVDGEVASVSRREVDVPQILVTLVGPDGQSLYAWSVTPKAGVLEPGESVAFETQLSTPPDAATGVRLTFAHGSSAGKPDNMQDKTNNKAAHAAAPGEGADGQNPAR